MKNLFHYFRLLHEQNKFFREKAEQGEPLSILDDRVFKSMLASDTEDSREALRSLLSACIRREVSTVQVLNSEIQPVHLEAKLSRFDVRVTFNDGEAADLEMQIGRSDDDLKDRSSQYLSMLQAGQTRRGKLYKETKRAYQIFFLNFILFPDSDKLPRRYGYREETEHDLLSDKTEILFYELPKLERYVKDYLEGRTGTENLSEDEKWCIFMKYRHDKNVKSLINELCRKEAGIMKAEQQVVKLNRSYLKYMRNLSVEKDKIDLAYKLNAAYKKGAAEGQEKGQKERDIAIAKKALAEGSTSEFVQKITELDMQTIQELAAGKR